MLALQRHPNYRKPMVDKKAIMADNHDAGTQFENLFKKQAQMQGFYVEKNYLSCKLTPFGPKLVKKEEFCELDWKLVLIREGMTGFFETKSLDKDFFIFSEFSEFQIKRAAFLNEINVPSGFVVYFRPLNDVYFFTGEQIVRKGGGNRFRADEGIRLGDWTDFALGNLFVYTDFRGVHQG